MQRTLVSPVTKVTEQFLIEEQIETVTLNSKKILFQNSDDNNRLVLLDDESNIIGYPTKQFLSDFSTPLKFPTEYIFDLPLRLQRDLLNHHLDMANSTKDNGLSLTTVLRNDYLTNSFPAHRPIVHPSDIAQTIYGTLDEFKFKPTVKQFRTTDIGLNFLVKTMINLDVTKKKGDILNFGFQIDYKYGQELEMSLFLERLVCLNGMTANKNVFSWRERSSLTAQSQLSFLIENIGTGIQKYGEFVQRARLMSDKKITGDPQKVLLERARSYGVTSQYHDRLLLAFNAEPGNTEWDLSNAFTRFGTHENSVPYDIRQMVLGRAGEAVEGYSTVLAELSRNTANRVGASIIKTISDIDEDDNTINTSFDK